ncbi:MAG: hypothetical protein KC503_05875 [Myxococcales bacterium]|nr:hypothetical protein [Myxococcales bacterium]
MEAIPVVLIGLALGGGVVGVLVWAHKREKQRLAVWRGIAEARGGEFLEPSGSIFKRKPHRIEVDVGEARVLCDTYVVSTGKSSTTYTRFRAHFPLPAGPVFKVYREGVLSKLGKALGTQDVELGGDPDFDRVFMVKCNNPDATRIAWSPEAKQLMLVNFQDCHISSDGDEITLYGLGSWVDGSRIDAGIELVASIANADLFGASALRALPGATYSKATGPWQARVAPHARVVLQATQVEIRPVIQPSHWVGTRASTQVARPIERALSFTINAGQVRGDVPEGYLPPDAAAFTPALREATLEQSPSGELRLTWAHVEHDSEALMAGARLLALVAGTGQQGVFR